MDRLSQIYDISPGDARDSPRSTPFFKSLTVGTWRPCLPFRPLLQGTRGIEPFGVSAVIAAMLEVIPAAARQREMAINIFRSLEQLSGAGVGVRHSRLHGLQNPGECQNARGPGVPLLALNGRSRSQGLQQLAFGHGPRLDQTGLAVLPESVIRFLLCKERKRGIRPARVHTAAITS
jgi:hypothetical protein